jgi:hypothetical protein
VKTLPTATAVLALVLAAGCREHYAFTPVDPSAATSRALDVLDRLPNVQTQQLAAGRALSLNAAALVREGDPPFKFVYIFDWGSAANHLTFTLHRLGDPPPFNGSGSVTYNCSVPPFNGALIGAPLPTPLCPLFKGNTSQDKPKLLEIADLPVGIYALVMTNHGPGNETIRWAGIE